MGESLHVELHITMLYILWRGAIAYYYSLSGLPEPYVGVVVSIASTPFLLIDGSKILI